MQFSETSIGGVVKISATPQQDHRGFFIRTFCAAEFATAGLTAPTVQMALSHNAVRGTLRGLHVIPVETGEAKLVRCVRGAIFDVAVDLRRSSPTFRHWTGLELSADNMHALYLPKGVAHGFVTLSDNADVFYQFSEAHRPGVEIGVAWDDPEIAVDWPITPIVMSDRDRSLPRLSEIGILS